MALSLLFKQFYFLIVCLAITCDEKTHLVNKNSLQQERVTEEISSVFSIDTHFSSIPSQYYHDILLLNTNALFSYQPPETQVFYNKLLISHYKQHSSNLPYGVQGSQKHISKAMIMPLFHNLLTDSFYQKLKFKRLHFYSFGESP